ncbi:TetR family transcriptional regulator [Streptomyces sp. NPDC026673]|uniref:TetR/AcrR family transcriptional regulator n=1 Tax=Streptomyces sp. NPDC026673 TaxID=3155724 RepID=UPI003404D385
MTDGTDHPNHPAARGPSSTRTRILTAALELFAANGYSGTTTRGIAEQAQVDPAMIYHFFGNKSGLFQLAVSSRIDPSTLFGSPADEEPEPGRGNRGKWIARTFLSVWENEWTRPALVAVYRSGLSQEAIGKRLRDRVEEAFTSYLGHAVREETDRTAAFTSLAFAQLTGIVMLRYVFPVEPLASLDFEELMRSPALAIGGGPCARCARTGPEGW